VQALPNRYDGRLYEDVVKTHRNRKKLEKPAKKCFDVLVGALRYYSPRSLTGREVRDELRKLLGVRLAKRLLDKLRKILMVRRLRILRFYVRGWSRE